MCAKLGGSRRYPRKGKRPLRMKHIGNYKAKREGVANGLLLSAKLK